MKGLAALPLVLVVACGARTGTSEPTGDDGSHDGGRLDGAVGDGAPADVGREDAAVVPDAGGACPPPSTDFVVAPFRTVDVGFPVRDVDVGGDGHRLVVAATHREPRGESAVVELDARLEEVGRATVVGMVEGRVTVAGGIIRVAAVGTAGRSISFWGTELPAERRLDRREWEDRGVRLVGRPASDGRASWVVSAPRGPDTSCVRYEDDPPAESIFWAECAGAVPLGIASRPGRVEILMSRGRELWLAASEPTSDGFPHRGVNLDGGAPIGPAAFAWLEGASAPVVVGSLVDTRLLVRSYDPDGAVVRDDVEDIGFHATSIDVTSVPPPGGDSRVAFVVAAPGEGAAFVAGGPAERRVVALPGPCDAEHVSIAAGPCGYVVACVADDDVTVAIVVPPMR